MKKPYVVEPLLPFRVRKYLKENDSVDLGDMTDYLMKTYNEYKSKKKRNFIKSVSKVYEYEIYSTSNKHLGPIMKESDDDETDGSESDDSDDVIAVNGQGTPHVKEDNEMSPFSIDTLYRTPRPNERKTDTPRNDKKLTASNLSQNLKKRKINESANKSANNEDDVQIANIIKRQKKFQSYIPDVTLKDMKGINQLHVTACLLGMNLLRNPAINKIPNCVLLSGPSGSGKTMFATCLAGDAQCTLLRIPVSELVAGVTSTGEPPVRAAFKEAISLAPCILLLENLDSLFPKDRTSSKDLDKKTSDQIRTCLTDFKLNNLDKRVIIMAESRNPQNIDSSLRSLFKMDLFMPPLNRTSRAELLKNICTNVPEDFDFNEIALRTSSFVPGDLKDLADKAELAAMKRVILERLGMDAFENFQNFKSQDISFAEMPNLIVELQDFLSALPLVVPTLKEKGFPVVPETTWDDVGGLNDIKRELKDQILGPMQYGELHQKFRVKKPIGIMLWGPPGCGKTLLAKAMANHAGVNLYAVNGPELLNMYQGESERAVREVFKRAASVSPCVIFFDEFDSICPRRSDSSDSGSKITIVNTLLVEMNGFDQRKDIYVMAATNRPDMVDPAVFRPERFDTTLYVGLPDEAGRIAVFNACTKNGREPKLDSSVNFDEITTWCKNFSGADCAHLVYMASKIAIAEEIEQGLVTPGKDEVGTLCRRHFVAAFKRVSPSVGEEEQKKYIRMKEHFENSKKKGKGVNLLLDLKNDTKSSSSETKG